MGSRGCFCADPGPLNSTNSRLHSLSVVPSAICCFWWRFRLESWWWGFFVYASRGMFQLSSITQSCSTLCYPMDCSTPGLPVHHQLLEFTQTHVHWVGDAIHLILCCPLLLLPSIFPSIRVFSNESALRIRWPKYWNFTFNISPSNEQSGLISFRWTGWISLQSKGFLRVFSNTTVQIINSSTLSILYGPTLTSIYDYWIKQQL